MTTTPRLAVSTASDLGPKAARESVAPTEIIGACGHRLTSLCMVCRGKVGGSRSSPRKTQAVRRNARKPKRPRPP